MTEVLLLMVSMDAMNNGLARAGVYNKNQQKRITALAGIRNSAAHGKQGEFTREDVKSMIQEIERFLAQNMGEYLECNT